MAITYRGLSTGRIGDDVPRALVKPPPGTRNLYGFAIVSPEMKRTPGYRIDISWRWAMTQHGPKSVDGTGGTSDGYVPDAITGHRVGQPPGELNVPELVDFDFVPENSANTGISSVQLSPSENGELDAVWIECVTVVRGGNADGVAYSVVIEATDENDSPLRWNL